MNQPYYPNTDHPQWQGYQPYPQVSRAGGGGGTAVAAGVVALIEGVPLLLGAAALLIGALASDSSDPELPHVVMLSAGTVLCMTGSVIGAILLLCRRSAGRILLLACTFGFMVAFAIFVAWATAWDYRTGDVDDAEGTTSSVIVVVVLVLQLPILVLAGVPATARWIADRTARGYGYR